MEHTPFGYVIVDGGPVKHDIEAARLNALYQGYLLGLSFDCAADLAGIKATHSMVKRLLSNKRYLGDGLYPQLIDETTFKAVETERLRREKALGRDNLPKKEKTGPRDIHGLSYEKIHRDIYRPHSAG